MVATQVHPELQYTCTCSILEIYNEIITDLLNPLATRLQLRADQEAVFVDGLGATRVTDGKYWTSARLLFPKVACHPLGAPERFPVHELLGERC